MAENRYQAGLIRRIKRKFPGCEVLKNDSRYVQGMLDLSIYFGPYWAMLEVKDYEGAPEQPNQRYYVDKFNAMGGYASFIYPENEKEVLAALQEAFSSGRTACVPQS